MNSQTSRIFLGSLMIGVLGACAHHGAGIEGESKDWEAAIRESNPDYSLETAAPTADDGKEASIATPTTTSPSEKSGRSGKADRKKKHSSGKKNPPVSAKPINDQEGGDAEQSAQSDYLNHFWDQKRNTDVDVIAAETHEGFDEVAAVESDLSPISPKKSDPFIAFVEWLSK